MAKQTPDPLEGFNFVEFDEKTGILKIEIHSLLLKHGSQRSALAVRAIEIMSHQSGSQADDDNVADIKSVEFVPRSA